MSWRVLALPPLDEGLIRRMFAPLGADVVVDLPVRRDRTALLSGLADAELVVGDYTGRLAMDAEAVAAAPHLAFVQMPQVGVDSCDLDGLTDAGVPVANTAGANARSVAEWAVGAAFALCRRFAWGDRRVRAGEWPQQELLRRGTHELHTKRVGVLGFGAIGAEAARLFAALGCSVSYWSRRRRPEADATYRDLDDLLADSDILVVAVPLNQDTSGLLGAERLALLPQGALLINVARAGAAEHRLARRREHRDGRGGPAGPQCGQRRRPDHPPPLTHLRCLPPPTSTLAPSVGPGSPRRRSPVVIMQPFPRPCGNGRIITPGNTRLGNTRGRHAWGMVWCRTEASCRAHASAVERCMITAG